MQRRGGAARTNTRPGAGERSAAARRISADVLIQAGLGRFFAAKTRAAVLWAIWRQSGGREALEQAIKAYRTARDAWAETAATARPVYREDVTYGMTPHLRGHWADRLPAIDQDLADMIAQREQPAPSHAEADAGRVRRAIEAALASTRRRPAQCRHTPPPRFRAGQAVGVVLAAPRADVVSASLYYRHVNQAEKWRNGEMAWRGDHYAGTIPAEYTSSPFPLQYYFAVRERPEGAFLYPGLAGDLSNQPYFVVRQA